MHILIFLTVPLFVPPCAACGSGIVSGKMYSLDLSHLRHTKKNRNIIEEC